jgi:hypothetical protein
MRHAELRGPRYSRRVRFAASALPCVIALIACSRPAPEPRAVADPPKSDAALADAPPALPTTDGGRSEWVKSCAKEMQRALDEAAKKNPSLASLAVAVDEFDTADGVHVEEVSIRATNFHAIAARYTPPEAGDDTWKYRAESLAGSYHRIEIRVGKHGQGTVAFDGLSSSSVAMLLPFFKDGVDRCLA